MNVGIIVATRLKSDRLPPAKVLLDIGGRRAIDILADYLKRSRLPVVFAIPRNQRDNALADIAVRHGFKFYRGEDDSPLHRLQKANEQFGFEHVVRVTHDDLMIDPNILAGQIQHHIDTGADYTFCADCPEGVAAEVIKGTALKLAAERAIGQDVEYVSYNLKTPDFKVEKYAPPIEYHKRYRVVLDYPEDLTVLRILFGSLTSPFSTLDVTNFLGTHRNWYISLINKMPEITVYTCAHNQSQYLDMCMDSVMTQADVNLEYIVVDDASTDGTPRTLLDWWTRLDDGERRRVRIHRNDVNMGLPASCNRAIGMARGKFVVRLDSDDWFLPGALKKMLAAIGRDRQAAALFADYVVTDEQGVTNGKRQMNTEHHPGCCLFLKWAVHDIRYREGLQRYEGREFMERFSQKYGHAHFDEPCWAYRRHEGSKSWGDKEEMPSIL